MYWHNVIIFLMGQLKYISAKFDIIPRGKKLEPDVVIVVGPLKTCGKADTLG